MEFSWFMGPDNSNSILVLNVPILVPLVTMIGQSKKKTWVCFTNDRCSQCAHFSARIGHAHSANEKAALEYAQKIHLSNVKAYRTLQCRLATLSEQSTVPGATESCLMIAIDGLDQAKTRYPRNLRSSKTLDKCWRPQVHLIGYICYGATYLNEWSVQVIYFWNVWDYKPCAI